MKTSAVNFRQVWDSINRTLLIVAAILVVVGPVLLLNQTATAAQITTRSLLISSAQAGGTANYTFTFTPGSTTQVQSFKIQSCTTALGTCTAPTSISIGSGTVTSSGFQGATVFTKDTTTAGCTTADTLCGKRTDVTAQTLTAHVITDTGATNQASSNCSAAANCTFFERITTFSDNAYTTTVDSGTVASSTTQLFTVNAAIQEVLSFCVGNTTVDNATSSIPLCTAITGTSLNLGTLNSTNISVSPVSAVNNGDANNGLAELSTNAVNGSQVTYDAIQQSGTNHAGALRVAGATCNSGTINTDQCITSAGTSAIHFTAGTEDFGMTVAGVNCSNVGSAYSCTYASGTNNLKQTAPYIGGSSSTSYDTDANLVSGTTSGFYAWDESGTAGQIASATTVVSNEGLILKFAATPNIVTPTGSYTAKADFVATPTF